MSANTSDGERPAAVEVALGPDASSGPAPAGDPDHPADGEPTAGSEPAGAPIGAVARGGALNLAGSVIYGAANFVLLIALNRSLGAADAGIVLVAIALFSIGSTVGELGCTTGLVRTISRERALHRPERLRPAVVVALVPVTVVGVGLGTVMWLSAGPLSTLLAEGEDATTVAHVLRAMAPFLPFASIHSVVVQSTRGFDTMVPQTLIERVGRALALPVVVVVAVAAGMGPVGVGAAWASTSLVALVFSGRALHRRVRAATASAGIAPAPPDRARARAFWAFTAPRAVGQASEVAVNWIDTVLVGAVLTTTAAGIYASGTRYILPGTYAAMALMQVTGPRISGLMAKGDKAGASELLRVVSGWQTMVMWPVYLITALFPSPLLRVFGPEVTEARGALTAISVAMLVVAPAGPVASVILMSGRSRTAMLNTMVLLAINVGGNLLLLERHGITAAGLVWATTILVAALLPGWQSARQLDVHTLGRPAAVAVAVAASTVGVVGLGARLLVGDSTGGLVLTGSFGLVAYLAGLWFVRSHLHLDALWNGIRRRS